MKTYTKAASIFIESENLTMTLAQQHLATIGSVSYSFRGFQTKEGVIELPLTPDKKRVVSISYRHKEQFGNISFHFEEDAVPKVCNIAHIENLFKVSKEAIHRRVSRKIFGREQ